MNRRMRNRTSGGVRGRRERSRPLLDPSEGVSRVVAARISSECEKSPMPNRLDHDGITQRPTQPLAEPGHDAAEQQQRPSGRQSD